MNIAQPVSSEVDSVEFRFLSPQEIKAISVKRIENDNTFDTLLNPIPGGLYDPALGSWGDAPCATCNLNQLGCPGHAGHIQLPVPVYHPVFMNQAYLLLRATCVYCKGFRLRAQDLHKYTCQLRLLQHGLVHEAHDVATIGESLVDSVDSEDSQAEEDGVEKTSIIRKRDKYVQECLRRVKLRLGDVKKGKHEGLSHGRREVIKEFLAEITKQRQCASCGGISPTYRKDRFVNVFEKSLSAKEKAKMAQRSLKQQDAMTRLYQVKSKPMDGVDVPMADDDDDEDDRDATSQISNDETTDVRAQRLSEIPDDVEASQRYISPMEVHARLVELFRKEQDLVFLLYNAKPPTRKSPKIDPDMFFITTILVPPNRYRPEARTGDAQVTEAQENSLYKSILRSCAKMAETYTEINQGMTDMGKLHRIWAELQEGVNALIDKNKNPVQGAAAKRNEDGIKQRLEKKEGLFRKNMMGKRVNFAARSVISPDPNIETNEIGVPPVFARKLTYPEPVTSHNFRDMQQAVINGVNTWPGAVAIEDEYGHVTNLRKKTADERISLANQLLAPTNLNSARVKSRNKKVHRHMTNGDVVIMNRQPTLHKPSMMGHRVRVLPGEKTIRMHYANCNAYNADFDGDEMNMHFPQNEIARAEALQIADTDHQYLSATQGKPLRGLIQDHLSVSTLLCSRDTFFSRGDYQTMVYSAVRPESGHIFGDRIQLVPPAIIKPAPRWTGKQVITTLLLNIQPPDHGPLNLTGETQVRAEQWSRNSEEGVVLFQDGEFITGILDKSQIGQAPGGLIHAIHEIYGPSSAGQLLNAFSRLLTRFLNTRAFSCGMDDLRLTQEGEVARRKELEAVNHKGLEIASAYVSLKDNTDPHNPLLLERLEEVLRDDSKQEGLDLLMNSKTSDITDRVLKACLPNNLEKPFPRNQMQVMTTSGAKGTRVNASLISCNLGQQVLESRRVPLMVSGKSLPCFKAFETNIGANGYISSRFLTGIRPQEYFFHLMAGREGLIDTAVKTSRSGYLQRCVIKGLEGLRVSYDTTVRDADGSIVQFLYGEDGLDGTKQRYLTDFKFVLENLTSEVAQLRYKPDVVDQLGCERSLYTKYMKSAIKHHKAGSLKGKDPLTSIFNPATNLFVSSEVFYDAMSSYLDKNADGLVRDKHGDKAASSSSSSSSKKSVLTRKNAEVVFAMKYLQSLVEPGEAVGVVAGQSVGEPSTQMTLNTFHLAGHSANNVTQGIPRLREILMTAAVNISTPSMTLYPNKELSEKDVERFAKSISALPLSYILDSVAVEEKTGRGDIYGLAKIYQIQFKLFPAHEYTETYDVTIFEVMNALARNALRRILALVKAEIKKRAAEATSAVPDIGEKVGVVEMAAANATGNGAGEGGGDDNDGDDDDGDNDNTAAKKRANNAEAVSYGPNDDADDQVLKNVEEAERRADMEMDEDTPMQGVSNKKKSGGGGGDDDDDDDEDKIDHNMSQSSSALADFVKDEFDVVTAFGYDEQGGEWCKATLEFEAGIPKLLMLNIVQKAVKKTLIREIPGIGSSNVSEQRCRPGGPMEPIVHVDGVNIRAMTKYSDYIDPHRIKSNDIAAVLAIYGVEACRSSIVHELSTVFSSHSIKVDNRHLNLIADYMTRNGGFTAFSRMGLRGNVSPFTKMSFETTLEFLKDAVLDGDWEDLATPSSRLVMGRLGDLGTGSFDVLTKLPTHYVASFA
ncbi:hypothetical protein E4U43_003756 [Claviceps pusilla]|uniref:DNA-directed RNA polymerase subunit n=1 Tax=Claviceps pusilla TaxID=123648 RepID=A0A9P7SUD4_9HYPO|nr:hypothetical protein E4U43_003756 [Claviceps pusilla]